MHGINQTAAVSFHELMDRVRLGDEDAAAELVRRYEPTIRMVVRARLTNPAFRCLLDTVDICQKVFSCFFQGARGGQFTLEEPVHLHRLLEVIARRKLASELEKLRTRRRGGHLRRLSYARLEEYVDPHPGPAQTAAQRELWESVLGRFSPHERWMLEERLRGCSWEEIAAQVGENPNALRMRYTRSLRRVARTLSLRL